MLLNINIFVITGCLQRGQTQINVGSAGVKDSSEGE